MNTTSSEISLNKSLIPIIILISLLIYNIISFENNAGSAVKDTVSFNLYGIDEKKVTISSEIDFGTGNQNMNLTPLRDEINKNSDIGKEIVNDMNDAQIYAKLLQGLQNAQQQPSTDGQPTGQQPPDMEGSGGVHQQSPPIDSSGVGRGNIGTGNVPVAGESEFSGSVGATGLAS